MIIDKKNIFITKTPANILTGVKNMIYVYFFIKFSTSSVVVQLNNL